MSGENIVRLRFKWMEHMTRRRPVEIIKITNSTPLGQKKYKKNAEEMWDKIREELKTMEITEWTTKCRQEEKRATKAHNKL